MRTNSILTFIAGIASPFLFGYSQTQGSAESLRNQLEMTYPLTVMDVNGVKVVKAGTILVVAKTGIQANTKKSSPFSNLYDDGKISAKGVLDRLPKEWPMPQSKILVPGDRVYLVNLDIREDSVVMVVQTCGGCNPAAADPGHKPHWASVQFKFVKGYLTATDLAHVQNEIGSVLALPSIPSAPAYSQSQQAPVQPQSQPATGQPAARRFEELAPPPTLPVRDPGAPTLHHQDDAVQEQGPADSTRATSPPSLYRANDRQTETGPQEPAQPAHSSAPPQQAGTSPVINSPVERKSLDKPNTAPPAVSNIERGMSVAKVASILGQPNHTENHNGQLVAIYGRKTVTFEKGRVVAITTEK
jgi:hypothetical protein